MQLRILNGYTASECLFLQPVQASALRKARKCFCITVPSHFAQVFALDKANGKKPDWVKLAKQKLDEAGAGN